MKLELLNLLQAAPSGSTDKEVRLKTLSLEII